MNLDDHVQMKFASTFNEAINAVKPLALFRAGYQVGLNDGLTIKAQVEYDRVTMQQQSDRDIGHAQGLAHAAFIASHCVLLGDSENEAALRDAIVRAIEQAQVEPAEAKG